MLELQYLDLQDQVVVLEDIVVYFAVEVVLEPDPLEIGHLEMLY
jgi:hypothetical protein